MVSEAVLDRETFAKIRRIQIRTRVILESGIGGAYHAVFKGRGTDLTGALRFAQRVMKRRGIVAVISDFQDRAYERALGVLRRRHDVIALHLLDPREGEFPDTGLVALVDPETGERVVVDASRPDVRRRLAATALAEARPAFKRTRVDALPLSTAESYEKPLSAFFKARERRR